LSGYKGRLLIIAAENDKIIPNPDKPEPNRI